MKDQKIIQLSERDHILLRPSLWIGSTSLTTSEELILVNDKFQKKELTYVPGLVKIVNEIIDNSVDEAVRTGYKFANRIKIDIDERSVSIQDNGRGIPVKKVETGEYMPEIAFCNARAGSNFDDDEERITAGLNGVGATLTNIYSKVFQVETADGSKKFSMICKNNLETKEVKVSKITRKYTKVEFQPDLERFGVKKIDRNHIAVLEQRVQFLSVTHPKIKFQFNGKPLSFSSDKEFMLHFSDNFEMARGDNWFIGVYANEEDEFTSFSYVNGLHMKKGGAHIDLIANDLGWKCKELLKKKFKEIKPADVKNKIAVVAFLNGFKNMKFDSQTKETLTNSVTEVREYFGYSSRDWDAFAQRIVKNKEIYWNIVEFFNLKEEMKKKRAVSAISGGSGSKRVQSDSYFPPIGKRKYLFITEGASATGGVSKVLGRQGIAYYSLRGKPKNVLGARIVGLVANKEFAELVDILELDLTDPETDMTFEKVVILSDQDSDGIHIRALMLTMFHRFAPKLIREGRVCYMNTPLLIAFKKGKPEKWFLSFEEYNEWKVGKTGYEFKYYKGLGSFNKEDLSAVIRKEGSIEKLFVAFKYNKDSKQTIEKWFLSKNAGERKKELEGRVFDLFSI